MNNCLIQCLTRIGSLFRVRWGLFGAYWRSVGGFVGGSIRVLFGDYLGPIGGSSRRRSGERVSSSLSTLEAKWKPGYGR